jgi:asparagine synthase (glutamine-hydrolysing)
MSGPDLTLRMARVDAGVALDVRSAPAQWRLADGRTLAVIAGPHPIPVDALVAWLDAGCPDPAPVRQGFAAVLADPASGAVAMAVGARSEVALHWSVDATGLCVSSHLRPLLDLQAEPAIDEEEMARYLWAVDRPDRTMYRGLRRLPAGHAATWRPGGTVEPRRWFWPQRVDAFAGTDFPAALRAVIDDAVAASLPASGDVAAQLSGGLDSTIVAALAARRLHPEGRRLHTLSHLVARDNWPDWLSEAADDAPYVEAMVGGAPGLEPHVFDSGGRSPITGLRDLVARSAYPFLNPLNTPWLLDLDDWVRAAGVPIVLTGLHGSAGYSVSRGTQYRRALARGEVSLVLRDVRARRARGESPQHVAATVVGDVLPRTVRAAMRLRRGAEPGLSSPPFVAGLEPPEARARENAVQDRAWWTASVLSDAPGQSILQAPVLGAWTSDPLGDAEVVRMLFAAPPGAWLGDGASRALARRTMAGVVPDVVRLREQRGVQAADVAVAVAARQDEYAEALAEVEASPLARTYIDVAGLRASMEEGVPVQGRDAWSWQLVQGRVLGFGLFLTWFEAYAAARRTSY